MIGFLKRFFFSFNILAAIMLAGSYLSAVISPSEAWVFALLGLAYPFLLLINIAFALFWLLQFNLRAILSLVVILAGMGYFRQTFQFRQKNVESVDEIRMVSYNAGLFGFFQSRWHVPEMISRVQKIDAHVLCVQEFLNARNPRNGQSTFDSVAQACAYPYTVFRKLNDGRKRGEYGMAVFSRYPVTGSGLVHFDGLTGNMCIYADIRIDSAEYRIYNVHLQSFKFRKQDYKFIEKLPEDNDEKIRQSTSLLKRMKDAYTKRAEQVDAISAHMDSCTLPYFVLGDFNDPPVSYSYATLSEGLLDAFVQNGRGMGKTYIGIMPNFRIDYILYPAAFEGTHYRTYKLSGDHSMVSAGLKFKKQ